MKKNNWMMVTALALLSISAPSFAEIYQWTDNDGKVHFSDTKPVDPKMQARVKQRDGSNLPGVTAMEPTQFREPVKTDEHPPTFATTSSNSNNSSTEAGSYQRLQQL